MPGTWSSSLRACRERAGVSQQALAREVGVSRQALIAIEAGRQVPSTALALAIAGALGRRVEDLFALAPADRVAVDLAAPSAADGRVVLGRIDDRWVAHPLADAGRSADALLTDSGARPLADLERLARNVLVAGCAPLLGVLAGRLSERSRTDAARWLWANSEQALDWLERRQVHVAGLHLGDDASGADHEALLRARLPGRALRVIHLARWRQGIVLAPGNPHAIRDLADAIRPGLRFARREPGAGAARLLAQLAPTSPEGPLARTHDEVAHLVRGGAAHAGIAIEAAAHAAGLDFVPLAEERFDLVVDVADARLEPVARFLDALAERAFRDEAGAMPGYDLGASGTSTELRT